MVDVGICLANYLKEDLARAADKHLWVISTIMLFKNSYSTKELKGTTVYAEISAVCKFCGFRGKFS